MPTDIEPREESPELNGFFVFMKIQTFAFYIVLVGLISFFLGLHFR